jgi:hypothetical protein
MIDPSLVKTESAQRLVQLGGTCAALSRRAVNAVSPVTAKRAVNDSTSEVVEASVLAAEEDAEMVRQSMQHALEQCSAGRPASKPLTLADQLRAQMRSGNSAPVQEHVDASKVPATFGRSSKSALSGALSKLSGNRAK